MVANCQALSSYLSEHGAKLVTGGTDNHLLLWDLKSEGLSGAKMEKVCEEASIIVCLGCDSASFHLVLIQENYVVIVEFPYTM